MLEDRNAETTELRPSRDGILFAAGFDMSLKVDRGHLVVRTGAGRQKAEGRFTKVARPRIRRLVVFGKGGYTSWEALAWLHGVGASFACIDRAGRIIATSGHQGPDQSALRRAQALGPENGSARQIAGLLLSAKVAGQMRVLQRHGQTRAGEVVSDLLEQLERADGIPPMLTAEARAASVYWSALMRTPLQFAKSDRERIPDHWRTFGERHSALTRSPRLASSPAGAILNYVYALAEFEARLALLAIGLDPGMGWFHRDAPYRHSAALDLLEAIRPTCDSFVIDLLLSRTFAKREFVELPNGQVHLAPVLARALAATALPVWEERLAAVAEEVGRCVAEAASSAARVRTPLTQASRKHGRSRRGQLPAMRVPPVCVLCGADVPDSRRKLCDECLPGASEERSVRLRDSGRMTLAAMRASTTDPAQSNEARARRSASLSAAGRAIRAWEKVHGTEVDSKAYEETVLPAIRSLSVPKLVAATGLSQSYCWRVRRGTKRLHPMHWGKVLAAATS